MRRNLCDDCRECKDNDKSLSYCFDVCGVPIDILQVAEEERNGVEEQTRWIPVTERLPENLKNVLVTCETFRGRKIVNFVGIGLYHTQNNVWIVEGLEHTVIAWMPLPKPYKEGEL